MSSATLFHTSILYTDNESTCLTLQVVRSSGLNATTDRLSAIDYFSTGQTNGAKSSSKGQEDDGEESGDSGTRGKRKQKEMERDVSSTKKKKKNSQVEVTGNVCGCLLHLWATVVTSKCFRS